MQYITYMICEDVLSTISRIEQLRPVVILAEPGFNIRGYKWIRDEVYGRHDLTIIY